MSTDAKILTYHPFTINEPKKLIREVAELFQVNTFLTFSSYPDIKLDEYEEPIEKYGIEEYHDNPCYVIDKCILNPSYKNIVVDYCDYIYKWMHDYAEEPSPAVKAFMTMWGGTPEKLKKECSYYFNNSVVAFDVYFDEMGFEISTGAVDLYSVHFNNYWWGFFYILIERRYEALDLFLKARENLIYLAKKLGNKELYFVQEHSDCGLGQGGHWDETRESIKEILESKETQKITMDLRKTLTDEDYLRENIFKRNRNIRKVTVFYDDLGPLDENEIRKTTPIPLNKNGFF